MAVVYNHTSLLVALLIRASELLLYHHQTDPSALSILAFVCQSP